jgi:hypothetical protein
MERKQLFINLGAIGAIILLAWFTVFPLIKNLRASNNSGDQIIIEITLCDVDARDLCVVTFGIDATDHMVITFQLPNADYPAFYVNGSNKGTENTYQCEAAKAVPTNVYCTGIRTPLGEAIDIEVYATDSDLLMARGTIMISAMVLSTPVNLAAMPESTIATPTLLSSPIATIQILPTPTVVFTFTPTPGVAYPGP